MRDLMDYLDNNIMEQKKLTQNLTPVSNIESCAIYGGRSAEVGEAVHAFGYLLGLIFSFLNFRKKKSRKSLALSN